MSGSVVVVFVGYALRGSMIDAVEYVRGVLGVPVVFRYFNVDDADYGRVSRDEYAEALRSADVLLLDIRGGDNIYRLTVDAVRESRAKVVVSLVGGSGELVGLTRIGRFSPGNLGGGGRLRKFFGRDRVDYATIIRIRDMFEKIGRLIPYGLLRDARNYVYILKYYENPTYKNMLNMMILILKEYLGVETSYKIEPPETLPPMGIQDFHTNKIYNDTGSYLENYKYSDKPLIGILFYGGHHYDQSLVAARKIAEKLEQAGYGVVPVFSGDLRYYLAIKKYLVDSPKPVDALIDLLWFRLAGGPLGGDHKKTLTILKILNTPVLHGIHLSSTIDEWLRRNTLSPIEVITTIILPELDGRIEPIVTHGRKRIKHGDYIVDSYEAVEDRVEKIACRATRWARLRRKPNKDKKLAIITYAYPPGKENIGKTSYLDVFSSLTKILDTLKQQEYTLPDPPRKEELKEKLLRAYLAFEKQAGTITCDELVCVDPDTVSKLYKTLPDKNREEITRFWGAPPKNNIVLPVIILGNILLGIQPSRGKHEDPSKIYHSRNIPPTHEYVVFYKWINDVYGADAIIHLGTHGTLEFLPGKETGLTTNCYPDILIGCTPNIYVYHVVNPSEASIAKRRTYAVIVSHQPPPITKYEPSEEIQSVERKIRQYYDIKQYSPERAEELRIQIIKEAEKQGLGKTIEEIQDNIEEYRRTYIPRGLHILGEKLGIEELVDYLVYVSRFDRGEIKSLHRILCEAENIDYEKILGRDPVYGKLYAYIEEKARKLIHDYIVKKQDLRVILDKLEIKKIDQGELEKTLNYLGEVAEKTRRSDEIGSLIRALSGEYIEPSPGGDPVRNPEVYPTGRNMYQLDPTNIPTDTAWRRGEEIAEKTIEEFKRRHGRYPRTISIVLWAFETMKTGGETVVAIFRLLGVKPKWITGYIRDIEVIPLEKLGRPRIDVVVNICGIFRDTFYNIVELIDKAVKTVSSLNEPPEMNYVIANNMEIKNKLGKQEIHRIFGPPPDKYATELTTMIEAGTWKSEEDLVKAYVESMRYAYGVDVHGIEKEYLFRELVGNTDIVLQVRDTVEYEITDLDHYYEFLGGLSRTVEEVKKSKPIILVADTTRERIKLEDVGESIRRGVITRLLNPKWLGEMLKHDHHGAEKIATRVGNLLGLAATTHGVDNTLWENIADKLVLDEKYQTRITQNNPWAMRKIIEKLLEAHRRGYWKTSREKIMVLEKILEKTNKYIEDLEETMTKH